MTVRPVIQHSWQLTPVEARELQARMRKYVSVCPLDRSPETVAGIDVSIQGTQARAAVALFSYPELDMLSTAFAEAAVSFPYVPGLLAFREGPVLMKALAELRDTPDVLMFDAQGMAHPRRMGLASHIGVLTGIPSVGCAKSRLAGEYREPGEEKGSWTPVLDGPEVIGAAVRTRSGVRPIIVSVGHLMDLSTAISLTLACATRYRLPEPTRWAHRLAGGQGVPS